VIANHNSPSQVVVSGTTAAVGALVAELDAAGVAAKPLNVACAFHSPLLADAPGALAARLADAPVDPPTIPVFANTTAAPYPADPAAIRSLLSEQVAGSVRFVDQIEAMYEAGVRVFVEAGPGRVLTQLVGKILGERPHRAGACDSSGESGVRRFLLALAELAVIGADLDTDVLFEGRAETLALGALPVRAPGWTLDGHLVRTAEGAVVAGSLQPADAFPALALGAPSSPERDATVLEYLRSIREVVAAERDVMLHYLGAPADALGSPVPSIAATQATISADRPSPPACRPRARRRSSASTRRARPQTRPRTASWSAASSARTFVVPAPRAAPPSG
jgi:acyl transferase domain-containing protein